MKIKENNYAFIDSQNLYKSLHKDQGWKLDYGRFRVYLRDKYGVTNAFLFIGYIPAYESLYTNLQKQGFIIIHKPTLTLPGGKPKGNVDAELILHTMIEWPNYDKAVIVSGDGDFHCLVRHLKENDKLKKIIIPNRYSYSNLLGEFLPDAAFMNRLREKLEYRK